MDFSMDNSDQKENEESFFHKVYVLNRFLAVAGFTISTTFYYLFFVNDVLLDAL